MRAVLQRVTSARVQVDEHTVGEIGKGLLILLGVAREDAGPDASWLAEKVAALRIFQDPEGRMKSLHQGNRGLVSCRFSVHIDGGLPQGTAPRFRQGGAP